MGFKDKAVVVILGLLAGVAVLCLVADVAAWAMACLILMTSIIGVYVVKNHHHVGSLRERALSNLQSTNKLKEDIASLHEQNLIHRDRAQEDLGTGLEALSTSVKGLQSATDAIASNVRQLGDPVKSLRQIIWEDTQQTEAFLQLLPRVEPRWGMPPLGRWALDAKSMLHLALLIEEHEPKTVVELGSGASTIWISYLVEKYGGRVYSFDHLEKFQFRTQQYIQKHELQDTAVVSHAPLEPLEIGTKTYSWYSLESFLGIDQIDLLLVDGPPGSTGPKARYPALPALGEKLSQHGIVVLDDSDRGDEQEILKRWFKENPELEQLEADISRLTILYGF